MPTRTIWGVAVFMTLAAMGDAVGDDLGPQIADEEALRVFYAGNTIFGENQRSDGTGFKWSEFHCPNGRALYVRGQELVIGRWRVADDQVCFSYPSIGDGEDNCFRLFSRGAGKYAATFDDREGDGLRVEIDGRLAGDPFGIQKLMGAACEEPSS